MKFKVKWLVGALIIGVCIVVLSLMKLGDQLVYFYTPAEAVAKAKSLEDQVVRVGALVKPGTLTHPGGPLENEFTATDLKGSEFTVDFHGTPPDMFKEGQGVVVEGRLTDGGKKFIAQNLLVKHSEEYKKPDDHAQINAEDLQKSLFKNEDTGSKK